MKTHPTIQQAIDRSGGRCERFFRHGSMTGQGVFRCHRKIAKYPMFITDPKKGGTLTADNLICLCNYCKSWAYANPDEAKNQGITK